MSTTKYNKQSAEYYVGMCPGQARPIEDAGKPGAECQTAEPNKVTRKTRRPPQVWHVDDSVARTCLPGDLRVEIDPADLRIVEGKLWRPQKSKHNYYASTGRANLMHRLIMGVAGKGVRVDHKDNNTLNNRRDNLRVASQTYNRANSRKLKTASSKFKGVRLLPNGRWAAAITKTTNGVKKRDHLGCFATEVEAAIAYNKRAIELFGEFAFLNKIEFTPA